MSLLSNNSKNTVDSKSPFAVTKFSQVFHNALISYDNIKYNDIVYVCIGTDRSTGDSLGPLVGHKLSNTLKRYSNVHVFGTLDCPVHAKNLCENIEAINKAFDEPFIVAIDACLGKLERIGYVSVFNGPLKPGAGVNKDLDQIGNMHITGVVNVSGFMEYIVLQNTRLNLVMNMANLIANSISYTMWKMYRKSTFV